jgi:hypothetical protein
VVLYLISLADTTNKADNGQEEFSMIPGKPLIKLQIVEKKLVYKDGKHLYKIVTAIENQDQLAIDLAGIELPALYVKDGETVEPIPVYRWIANTERGERTGIALYARLQNWYEAQGHHCMDNNISGDRYIEIKTQPLLCYLCVELG